MADDPLDIEQQIGRHLTDLSQLPTHRDNDEIVTRAVSSANHRGAAGQLLSLGIASLWVVLANLVVRATGLSTQKETVDAQPITTNNNSQKEGNQHDE